MSVEAAVRASLVANSGVLAMVSNRVYVGILPQGVVFPCVLIYPVTQNDDPTINSIPTTKWARLQIEAWADTYAAMQSLHDAINTALAGQSLTPTGYALESITPLTSGRYTYESEVEKHRRSRDYGIWWKTTA